MNIYKIIFRLIERPKKITVFSLFGVEPESTTRDQYLIDPKSLYQKSKPYKIHTTT